MKTESSGAAEKGWPAWIPALLPIGAIVGLNLLAHFLPFERASLSWDDLANMTLPLDPGFSHWKEVRSWLIHPSRPLVVSWVLLDWLVGAHPLLCVTLSFLANSLLAVAVYFLMAELIGDRRLGWVSSGLFVLLPNQSQLYHYFVIGVHVSAVYAVTAAGLALFMVYLRSSRRLCLWASLACYAVSIFWYETGFFLPVVAVLAALLYNRKKAVVSLLFFLPLGLNLLWRTGFLLGQTLSVGPSQPLAYFWHHLFVTVPNLYFGRQMIKWILYGLARFPFIELPWIGILLAIDALALWGLFRWLKKRPLPRIPLRAILLSVAIGVFFLVPSLMASYIESRHTALASIGFSILVLAAIRFLVGLRPLLLTALFGVGLAVCQGTAWNQVVSCRMNNAIAQTFEEKKESILQADRLIVDQHSFSKRIPYTWVRDPLNQLDQYWGVDGLLGRGFDALLVWVVKKPAPPLYVARAPVQIEGEMFSFEVYDLNRCQLRPERIPRKGTVLVDYAAVYPNGFHHGKREKP